MSDWRSKVVAEALTWDQTTYHHQARIKGAGVDCAMLLLEVFMPFGLVPRDIEVPNYPSDWNWHMDEEVLRSWVERFADPLPEGELPLPGDLVLYKFGRSHSHGAVVLEWPKVIHAVRKAGKVIIDDFGDEGPWRVPKLFYTVRNRIQS